MSIVNQQRFTIHAVGTPAALRRRKPEFPISVVSSIVIFGLEKKAEKSGEDDPISSTIDR